MLTAISPVDGRYASRTSELGQYFSEYALIKARTHVEVEYFIALSNLGLPQLQPVSANAQAAMRSMVDNFSVEDGEAVKGIERTTNHDVKAVEYFIKRWMEANDMGAETEWIHFALTSQDINNTSTPLLLKAAVQEVFEPALEQLIQQLTSLEAQWAQTAMLAHTHGQPASPTTVAKEIRVFTERLQHQLNSIKSLEYFGKFGGATGNFNAHLAAYPNVNWTDFGNSFLEHLGLQRIQTSTQIDHYDHLAELFQAMVRVCSIIKDMCVDFWLYISMEYFKQKTIAGEVGSSTMPHKVNPIDFENAEGNVGIAIAVFNHLATKLPVSRLQRDLTDSTVLRNAGVPFAHLLIALKSLAKGLGKLELNKPALDHDLDNNWAIVGEAIQTVLRREGVANPYELLKDLTRGNKRVTAESLTEFVDGLAVTDSVKQELKAFTPFNYTGNAD